MFNFNAITFCCGVIIISRKTKTDLNLFDPMNKIFYFGWICMLICVCTIDVFATNRSVINTMFTDDEIKSQIESISEVVDLRYTDEVKAILNTYLTNGKASTELIMSRSHYYFPIMEDIMMNHSIPNEIKFLSVVESSLNPTVKSKAGAVGLWQFMKSTARMYGLTVNQYYDERKDVTKSTHAAYTYLNDLYKRYGDWTLALAAYNCGPGNVNKAIRKAGATNYWLIRKYLPRETRRYIPKFVAFSYIMTYASHIGLEASDSFTEHPSFASAILFQKTKLKDISHVTGLDLAEIRKYNPSVKFSTPVRKKGFTLILPERSMLQYLEHTNQLDALSQVFYLKNATFSLDQSHLLPEEEIEFAKPLTLKDAPIINRKMEETTFLKHIPMQGFNWGYSNSIIETNVSLVKMEHKRKRLLKLRKRQSLFDFLREDQVKNVLNSNENIKTTGAVSIVVDAQ